MRGHNSLFRFAAALAIGGLLAGPAAPLAHAQSLAQAQSLAHAQSEAPVVDPPARVGRLARMTGTVSFHAADQTQWEPATQNFPVTSGSSFWTEPGAGADIEIGSTQLALDQSSEFTIDTLDDRTMTATLPQGAAFMRVRGVQPGEQYQIRTPRGTVTIAEPGEYDVQAGDTDHATTVTVVDGSAQVEGDNVSLLVRPHETAQITGTERFEAAVAPQQTDPFLAAHLPPPRALPTGVAAPPAIVAQMTGGQALEETGTWQATPEYGQVWYPPVAADWQPYRNGHWAYVAPWGWTWVDDAPWGFAPFHYGRWVHYGPRWGWVPVTPGVVVSPLAYPCYAPALVSFVGGVGVGLFVGAALSRPVGWYPLAPREAYIPPYRVSNTYVRNVNIRNVTNVTNITNTTVVNNITNRNYTTMVPAAAMAGSRPIAPVAQRVPPQQLAAMQPQRGAPVAPSTATMGVTPAVARQMNLAAPPAGAPLRQSAPGPAFQLGQGGVGLRPPGGARSLPGGAPINPAAAGAPVVPGAPAAAGIPGGPTARPGMGAAAGAVAGGAAALGGAALLNRQSAPGPAIAPHQPGVPGIAGGAPANPAALPALRPGASPAGLNRAPGAPGAPPGIGTLNTVTGNPRSGGTSRTPPGAASPVPGAPNPIAPAAMPSLRPPGSTAAPPASTPNAVGAAAMPALRPPSSGAAAPPAIAQPGIIQPPRASVPQVGTPSVPATARLPAPGAVATPAPPPARPFTSPAAPHPAPAPMPQVQHAAPVAPVAMPRATPPAPLPRVQHAAPPPAPVQHAAPPPPPPAQHAAPPAPRPAPATHNNCPPGRPTC
jgi:hypothetical protein